MGTQSPQPGKVVPLTDLMAIKRLLKQKEEELAQAKDALEELKGDVVAMTDGDTDIEDVRSHLKEQTKELKKRERELGERESAISGREKVGRAKELSSQYGLDVAVLEAIESIPDMELKAQELRAEKAELAKDGTNEDGTPRTPVPSTPQTRTSTAGVIEHGSPALVKKDIKAMNNAEFDTYITSLRREAESKV